MSGYCMPGPNSVAELGGCWTCAHFGERWGSNYVLCRLEPEAPDVQGNPDGGCVFWMREPGADDVVHHPHPPCSYVPPFRPARQLTRHDRR
jgi:hypothetical protein